jgi:hypothetical protein
MNRKYLFILAISCLSLLFLQCTKPSENFDFSINADVFDQTVALKFYDAATPGVAPKNIVLTVSGVDAAGIYEISGKKTFNVVDGIISLGIHPSAAPVEGRPTHFIVEAKAEGYLSVRVPVTVLAGQETKMISTSMINTDNPPEGVSVAEETVELEGGVTVDPVTVATPAAAGETSASVGISPGTSFRDANGNTISGSTLTASLVYFSTSSAASLNAFPGNGFNSDDIKDAQGNTVSGMFQTAGFTAINMSLSGTQVRSFSQPIEVAIGVSATQTNPATGQPFAVGDVIPVWSYQEETGAWAFEKEGTITNNNGNLEIAFETAHLTYYNLAFLQTTCEVAKVTFQTGLPEPETFLVDIFAGNETTIPAIGGYIIQVANNGVASFENIPTGDVTLRVYRNIAENSQTNWKIRSTPIGTYTGNLCGNQPTISLNIPVSQPITFNIEGKCRNNAANPVVRPTVDVWYRINGSRSEFMMLGHVSKGHFKTTNLNFMSTYDFKVIWDGGTVFMKTKQVDSLSYTQTIEVPQEYERHFCK